jgi:ribosomal protein S18 acetylase RimI-like enzyme
MPGVRKAEPRDSAALANLAERTFRATFGAHNTPEDMDAYCAKTFGARIQAREIADPRIETFVCAEQDALLGYAQLRWQKAPRCVVAAKPVEIQRIYVDARWHGSGIARMLMDELLAAASKGGADRIWLGVWERNPRATAFYRKLGFDHVGDHVFQLGSDHQRDLVFCRAVHSIPGAVGDGRSLPAPPDTI